MESTLDPGMTIRPLMRDVQFQFSARSGTVEIELRSLRKDDDFIGVIVCFIEQNP
jgi:hypothetical protein